MDVNALDVWKIHGKWGMITAASLLIKLLDGCQKFNDVSIKSIYLWDKVIYFHVRKCVLLNRIS